MNITYALVMFGLNLVAPLVVGNLMRRCWPIHRNVLDRIVNANLYILVTLLGVFSLWIVKLEIGLLWMPVIACLTSLVAGGAGIWRARQCYASPAEQGSYVISAMISNRNTAGTIAVFLLLGEQGYANARLFVAVNWPFLFAVCYPVAALYQAQARQSEHDTSNMDSPAGKPPWLQALLHPNQIPILGMALGLILNACGLPRPEVLGAAVEWLVPLNMWLFLVPLGYELDMHEIRQMRHDIAGLSFVKFLITPLAAYLFGKAFGLSHIALLTCVILGCSPVAIQAVVTARLYRLDHPLAMGAFVLTMLLFLVFVIPIIMLLFWWFNLPVVTL